jgi:hypothetical protein
MWVFDGEEWTQDDGSIGGPTASNKPETLRPRYDQLMPELQVIEIVPVTPRTQRDVPPLPMP